MFDFTDPSHPKEIAYFDRGAIDANKLVIGGYWAGYYYNGYIGGFAHTVSQVHACASVYSQPPENPARCRPAIRQGDFLMRFQMSWLR